MATKLFFSRKISNYIHVHEICNKNAFLQFLMVGSYSKPCSIAPFSTLLIDIEERLKSILLSKNVTK